MAKNNRLNRQRAYLEARIKHFEIVRAASNKPQQYTKPGSMSPRKG
jgi:hypothetical protein